MKQKDFILLWAGQGGRICYEEGNIPFPFERLHPSLTLELNPKYAWVFCNINIKQEEMREEEKESACRAAYP